ncbi:histidine-type phosphatase [Serratia sp. M24T3]|uniref:histidine-type phosphatase n=1 Tax=Serratia sp. M24T3 TaxID=932213 RepID=UPI00025B93A2|nr:histidine-type phosphatase [Serratia sp. M24T3]EIC84383.1 phosphoanhydride phosphorylase [Serratia sp. M24T3]
MSVKPYTFLFSAVITSLFLPASSFAASDAVTTVIPAPQDLQLQQAVILSRHGVRSPTKQTKEMKDLAGQDWPKWPVKPGYLTPRGQQLVSLMGTYYGDYFKKEGLLSSEQCPGDSEVFGWGDTDQRTRLTTQTLLSAIAPHCHVMAKNQADLKKPDPVFHPLKAGICTLDKATAIKAIDKEAGGSLDALDQTYAPQLKLMSQVLNYPQSSYCQQMKQTGQTCSAVIDIPSSIKMKKKGTEATLEGGIGMSSTFAENFLLEDAQGMQDVAWGRIKDQKTWQALLELHNLQFRLMSGTPYIAKSNGTPVLQVIDNAFGAAAPASSGFSLPSGNKVLILGGHDTNIENVAGALGLDWTLTDQPDHTPPAGALMFERWQDKTTHQQYISLRMVYQTQDQMRTQHKLTLKHPPMTVALSIPGCENIGDNKLCAIGTFHQVIEKAQLPQCKI